MNNLNAFIEKEFDERQAEQVRLLVDLETLSAPTGLDNLRAFFKAEFNEPEATRKMDRLLERVEKLAAIKTQRGLVEFYKTEYDASPAKKIRQLIESELAVGASTDEIEAFFERHGIDYSYNEFVVRYYGIIRNVAKNKNIKHHIRIYIMLDDDMTFKGYEVHDGF